jgi:hypothetical protein
MTPSGNGNRVFAVRASQVVANAIKQLQQTATDIGVGDRVLEALKAIHHRLRLAPTVFGAPLFRLPAFQLQVRIGIVHPLVVIYAVHEVKPLVFIKEVNGMPGQGL